ncbi:MAG: ribulokinase, partial [Clostridia bacterium]|nr:ribulokinase [Clostridia bacterium]
LGMTLQTKPEEIYRALIEATAYGTRVIVEQYEQNGIAIKSICAAGGIAQKDEMMMQIYADVLNREIRIASSTQAGALGSAIYASVAANIYPDVKTAAEKLAKPDLKVYKPNQERHELYSKLYAEYKKLHHYFGKGGNDVMEKLRF